MKKLGYTAKKLKYLEKVCRHIKIILPKNYKNIFYLISLCNFNTQTLQHLLYFMFINCTLIKYVLHSSLRTNQYIWNSIGNVSFEIPISKNKLYTYFSNKKL